MGVLHELGGARSTEDVETRKGKSGLTAGERELLRERVSEARIEATAGAEVHPEDDWKLLEPPLPRRTDPVLTTRPWWDDDTRCNPQRGERTGIILFCPNGCMVNCRAESGLLDEDAA